MNFRAKNSAFTLIEMTVVIGLILALVAIVGLSAKQYIDYQNAKLAGDILRTAENAERMYLADNPTLSVASISADGHEVWPYMPNSPTTANQLPPLPYYKNQPTTINFSVFPPVAVCNGAAVPRTGPGMWSAD